MRRDPTSEAVLQKYGDSADNNALVGRVITNLRKNNRKSDQYYLVLAQLLTPEERKAAAKESRKAWE